MAQENIFFVTMLAARVGVQTLAYSFPQVNIITTALDPMVIITLDTVTMCILAQY